MKQEMTRWNISQPIPWLDKWVHHIFTGMFIEIRKAINDTYNSGKHWSKWVDKVWNKNCMNAVHLNAIMELTDNN